MDKKPTLQTGSPMRDDIIAVLDELGLTRKPGGSRALIKLLLSGISGLLILLITVVWIGIDAITENQKQEIKINSMAIENMKDGFKNLQYAVKDIDRRVSRIEKKTE